MPRQIKLLRGIGLLIALAFLLVVKTTPETRAVNEPAPVCGPLGCGTGGCGTGGCGVTAGRSVLIPPLLNPTDYLPKTPSTTPVIDTTAVIPTATGSSGSTTAGSAADTSTIPDMTYVSAENCKFCTQPLSNFSAIQNGTLNQVSFKDFQKLDGTATIFKKDGAYKYENGNWTKADGTPVTDSTKINELEKLRRGAKKAALDNKGVPTDFKNEKPNTDKCILITPGMSSILGKMYGEPGVKAKNDGHRFCDEIQRDETCSTSLTDTGCVVPPRLLATPASKEKPTPKYPDITPIMSKGKCVWAVDWKGDPAYSWFGQESKENFDIRTTQTKENIDRYGVTQKIDKDLIAKTGADSELHKGKGKEKAEQSNEQINEDAALGKPGTEKIGNTVTKITPNAIQHNEYWGTDSSQRGYTVGSGKKKMRAGSPLIAGNPSKSINSNKMDVDVTKDCDYKDNKGDAPDKTKPDKQNPWTGTNGTNPTNPGSNGPGGGDENGGLGKLLPALMQALQGLGKGGNQQPSPSPTASPNYVCPTSTNDIKVCGINGATYNNRCIAEYQNKIIVKHEGVCTSSDIISVNTASQILADVTNSGIPQNLISTVVNIVTNIIVKMFTTGSTLPQSVTVQ